jgi:uncharacterized membrane protein YoaK (UPF0700 family)
VAGVVLAHGFISWVSRGGRRWFVVTLAVEVFMLFAAGVLIGLQARNVHIVVAIIACAMGWRNRAMVEANIPDMPTTVLQATLVKTIMDTVSVRASTPRASVVARSRRFATILGMFTGGVVGALLLRLGSAPALISIAGFEACVVALYSRAPRFRPMPETGG